MCKLVLDPGVGAVLAAGQTSSRPNLESANRKVLLAVTDAHHQLHQAAADERLLGCRLQNRKDCQPSHGFDHPERRVQHLARTA